MLQSFENSLKCVLKNEDRMISQGIKALFFSLLIGSSQGEESKDVSSEDALTPWMTLERSIDVDLYPSLPVSNEDSVKELKLKEEESELPITELVAFFLSLGLFHLIFTASKTSPKEASLLQNEVSWQPLMREGLLAFKEQKVKEGSEKILIAYRYFLAKTEGPKLLMLTPAELSNRLETSKQAFLLTLEKLAYGTESASKEEQVIIQDQINTLLRNEGG